MSLTSRFFTDPWILMYNMSPQITLLTSKSLLTKSGLPGSTFVINPYNGCLFGCMYCYAAQIARWKHPTEKWGSYLDVKINARELLEKELKRLETRHKAKNFGSIFFSSVTDPYVSLEGEYKLTRRCLEALADFGYQGEIAIQTKSPLVIRDIDVLKKLKKVAVGFTITSLNDKVSRFLEVKAPPVSTRFKALKKLCDAGIATYAFVGPILPYFVNKKNNIKKLLDKLEKVGVKEVWFEHINLSPKIKERLYKFLKKQAPELILEFEEADIGRYRKRLDKVIKDALKGRGLKMGLGEVIYHRKTKKAKRACK
ncbi:radical SAM protein [bacterium (Candidatus Torokbacteria) CG_4_10_14_0_2_um_filter_35_8]|nr:MAG: radical SAM protein [bacterium (Candidatus Torokbacteria) CG_4_10_14_0_2_um_filter_35_8]